jgi:hypothetical protein
VLSKEFTEAPLTACWGFYHRTTPAAGT